MQMFFFFYFDKFILATNDVYTIYTNQNAIIVKKKLDSNYLYKKITKTGPYNISFIRILQKIIYYNTLYNCIQAHDIHDT